jgi:hypothetical protein
LDRILHSLQALSLRGPAFVVALFPGDSVTQRRQVCTVRALAHAGGSPERHTRELRVER